MPAIGRPARYLRQVSKKKSRTWSRVGLYILRLPPELAQVADQALRALGLPRHADVAAVQDQPVVRILEELGRRELEQLELHFKRILPRRDTRAVGDTEDMRVHRHGLLAEGSVEHDICRLSAYTGERLKLLSFSWDFSVEVLEQQL